MSGNAVPQAAAGGRDPRLDGLRAIAILLVLVYHATAFQLATSPLDRALLLVPAVGLYGVDLFFVLSGFLITGILLRTREGHGYFRTFYARRTLRIFPAYYAILVLFLLIFPLLTPQAEQFWKPGADHETFWYWTYLSNFHVAATGRFHHYFLGVSWSLAIEEQFYLFWPLVVWVAGPRRLARVCWLLIGAALAARLAVVQAEWSALAAYTLTPCRLDTLATGALIAIHAREPGGLDRFARIARVVLPAAAACFMGFVAAHVFGLVEDTRAGGIQTGLAAGEPSLLFYTSHPLVVTAGYTVLCIAFGSLLLVTLTTRGGLLERALSWQPLVSIGTYSYAIYLLHRFAIEIARNFLNPMNSEDGFWVTHLAFWGLTLALSYALARLSWLAIEAPFLRLKRHFPYPTGPRSA